MTKAATFQLEMTRFIRAPRDRVFDAFTDQAALAVWHCPRGMSVLEASADPRVGGRYRVVMGGRDGSRHIAVGEYQQLDRADFLAYTCAWEAGSMPPDLKTLIEVTLTDQDGGTHLHMRHSGFPDMQTRNGHLAGWQSVFNRLSDYLDPEGSAGTVTVYGDPRSSYCRTVRMALEEKGVRYTLQLEQAYEDRDYLVGGTVSMADLFLAPILAYLDMFPEGAALLEKRPNLQRGQAVMRARPSFAATQPQLH